MEKLKGIWITAELCGNRTVSPVARLMMGVIQALARKSGTCTPTNQQLGDFVGLKESQARQVLYELIAAEMVTTNNKKERVLTPVTCRISDRSDEPQPADFSTGDDFPTGVGNPTGQDGAPVGKSAGEVSEIRQVPVGFPTGDAVLVLESLESKKESSSSSPAPTHEEGDGFSEKNEETDEPEWRKAEREKLEAKAAQFQAVQNNPPPVAAAPSRDDIRAMLLGNEASRIIASNHNRARPFEEVVDQFLLIRENDKADPWTDPDDCRKHFRSWIPFSTIKAPTSDATRQTSNPSRRKDDLQPNASAPRKRFGKL